MRQINNYNCIVILGPTASGKTRLACSLAYELNGEIISADSRQVYKYLNIGTGKDLNEYFVNGQEINYHLIDACAPNEQFYLHQFIEASESAFNLIKSKNKLPIICGGTGLYIDSLRKDFSYTQIKEDSELRAELESLSKEDLQTRLKKFPEKDTLHADLNSKKRLIRAIEVAKFLKQNPKQIKKTKMLFQPYYIGIQVDIEERKKLISERLVYRINNGLIEEVETLIEKGITYERLEFLGLEYKFSSLYLQRKISKEELIVQLKTAIFQFAKRQMTWFRKMEKEGVKINWVKNTESENLIKNLKNVFTKTPH